MGLNIDENHSKKTGVRRQIIPLQRQVTLPGEVSNFFIEDYESIMILMDAEKLEIAEKTN